MIDDNEENQHLFRILAQNCHITERLIRQNIIERKLRKKNSSQCYSTPNILIIGISPDIVSSSTGIEITEKDLNKWTIDLIGEKALRLIKFIKPYLNGDKLVKAMYLLKKYSSRQFLPTSERDFQPFRETPKIGNYTVISDKAEIGKNVRIWHLCYIGDNVVIGDETVVGSLTHVDYNVKIGKKCRIQGMVYIPPLTVIEDEVFIGPGVIFTNDPFPVSKKLTGVYVEEGAVIGAGAMIKAGVRIGKKSVIGMGSVVTKDVPPGTVVFGNPAKSRYTVSEYIRKKLEWEIEELEK